MALPPQEVIRRLSQEYGEAPFRPHGDAIAELALTVLSQNTSDTNSGRAFARLLAAFPGWEPPPWERILAADVLAIAGAIQVGGLARIKAPRLKKLLAQVKERAGGWDLSFLGEMPLEEAKAWLRSLSGVGPKTAACVLLFALGRPALPVDTHVYRVSRRLGLLPADVGAEEAHQLLEETLRPQEVFPFHIYLVRHGRRLCRAQRPLCPQCPLRADCPSAESPRSP